LAMGMQLAIARLGTALALATSLPIALYSGTVATPLLICLFMLALGLIAYFSYTLRDKKLDESLRRANLAKKQSTDDEFRLQDLLYILKNKGWWYVSILCALFYSAVFPFLKFATNLMIMKYNVPETWAGAIPSLLPFGTILLTPFFGNLYDRKGKGATIMIIGALLIILVHALFALPMLNHWSIAIALMIVLGIGFSLVPSAMWPSVPKIIPEKQLGTAYALIFWVQNATALMTVPAMIGWVLNKYCVTGKVLRDGVETSVYNYTLPMIIFTGIGLLSLLFAFLLKAEDRKKKYGLELPNIKK